MYFSNIHAYVICVLEKNTYVSDYVSEEAEIYVKEVSPWQKVSINTG